MERHIELAYSINTDRPCKYLTAKHSNILDDLKREFTGKCFNNKFITEITDVRKSSKARSQVGNNSGKVTINVIFGAKAFILIPNYIIPDATIYISNGQVLASHENIQVSLLKSNANKILVNGQKAPIIIGDMIKYNTGNNINAIGKLFTGLDHKIYNINGDLCPRTYVYLQPYLKLIEDQIPLLQSIKKEVLDIVNNSIAVNSTVGTTTKIDVVNVVQKSKDDTVDITGYWSRTTADSSVYNKEISSKKKITQVGPVEAFKDMLWEIYNMRRLVIGMSTYKEENVLKLLSRPRVD